MVIKSLWEIHFDPFFLTESINCPNSPWRIVKKVSPECCYDWNWPNVRWVLNMFSHLADVTLNRKPEEFKSRSLPLAWAT